MRTLVTSCLLAILLACCFSVLAQTPPAGFVSSVVSSGWNEPVGLTFTSTGSKMFVWERPGKVWVVVNGQRQLVLDITPEVGAWEDQGLLGFALDPNFNSNGYMYLLYVVDRHYLQKFGTAAYSDTTNDYYSPTIGRLTRYTATPAGTGYTVNLASRKILLGTTASNGIPSTFNGHVVNTLLFGTDGTLLVSTGDGGQPYPDLGSFTDTYYAQALIDGVISTKENVGSLRAQLVDCLSGKILRLDPATGAGIASNPFYDAANPNAPRSKVWALGFRNPFRMSIKPGTGSTIASAANPGVLYVGDVGAQAWEELDVVDRPGQNFGWPLFEGLASYPALNNSNVYNRDAPNPLYNVGGCTKQFFYFQDLIQQATPSGTATFPNTCNTAQAIPASIPTFVQTRPLLDWGHGAGPSRTGIFSGSTAATVNVGAAGSPVSGAQFGGNAALGGVFYPYNDFPAQYRNTYFFGDYVGGWIRNLTVDGANQPSAVGNFVGSGAVPVAFAVSPGEMGLFYVNFYPQEIRKISYGTVKVPPVAVATSNKTYGPSPLAVQFTGNGSSDPGGSALTYLWNFGDGTTSTVANPTHTFTAPSPAPAAYNVILTVTNAQNLTSQAKLTISANNTPPQVTITSPVNNALYPLTGNTTYNLRATVVDAEHSGHLLSYEWQTVLHHEAHLHPDPVDTTRRTSTVLVPYGCGAETYYYTISLTVTDAGGLATTQEVRLNPDCASTSFTLVDADAATDVDIQPLVNGAVLNLATLPTRNLNIRANANPATTGSVVFVLGGAESRISTENVEPYALFSDVNGDYNPWTPTVGNYTLLATPYDGAGGSGTAGTPLSISFTVIDQVVAGPFTLTTAVFGSGTVGKSPDQATYPSGSSVTLTATPAAGFQFTGWSGDTTGTASPLTVTMTGNKNITATFTASGGQQVTGYTLVNADTYADIQPLAAGATLNLATLPTRNLNIRADTNPATVGSVVFALSGAATQNQTESVVPYALFSDSGGAYNSWTPPVGSYSLLATPYTAAGGGGTAGTPLSMPFSVIDQPGGPTFYRGINLNGGALTLDGQSWVGSSGAANLQLSGTAFANQGVALSPATDATRAGMIRSSIWGRTVSAALTNTPAGTYAVYLYVWEDNFAQSFSVTLEGQTVLANYNSGAAGHWDRLGPFTAAVTDGTINIATSGGDANLSGIEVWNENIAARSAPVPTANGLSQSNESAAARPNTRPGSRSVSSPAQVFPNPSPDGRLRVLLPADFQGQVSYTLVSALGTRLAEGQLGLAPAAQLVAFDFSHEMRSTGLYFLLLNSQGRHAELRLERP